VVRPALALALALATACAHRQPVPAELRTRDVAAGGARFTLRWFPEDDAVAAQVERMLERAAPRVQRWGGLAHPVTITIHPSHEALEAAAQNPGYDWLHAWAKYQTVELQSPRTWEGPVRDRHVEELLTHELTHCAVYQRAGDGTSWPFKEIPRWFGEGLATYTAGQGYRFASVEQLWAFYERTLPGEAGEGGAQRRPRASVAIAGDPIVDPDPIYQEQSDIVYGAAYHATEFLIARYGEERVDAVLAKMGQGMRFPAAFRAAVGITDAEFAADFRRYVVWQGWRR
jgi:hypothetical protein